MYTYRHLYTYRDMYTYRHLYTYRDMYTYRHVYAEFSTNNIRPADQHHNTYTSSGYLVVKIAISADRYPSTYLASGC